MADHAFAMAELEMVLAKHFAVGEIASELAKSIEDQTIGLLASITVYSLDGN